MASVDTEIREYGQFIGGDWVEASDGTFEDRDPYTGDVVARVPSAERDDARGAVEAAATAFPGWSQTPPAERQRIFLNAADVLESRREEIVELLARETGCSFGFGMFQLGFVPGLFRQAAALAYAPVGQVLPSDVPGTFAMGLRRSVGVVGAIAPWNAALILSARSIAAPIALGNTVVLKPSEWSPISGGLLWGEIFTEAGLPPGVLNIVTHAPGEAGPIGVELGGYNPLIVLADADLEYAVNATTFGAFLHQGQICMSARRIIVERPIAEEFIERLAAKTNTLKAGDPKEHDTIIGPLINEQALATVKGRVDDAVAKGARILAGGEAKGTIYEATLLADVPPDSAFARVETFGPVAAIEVVDSADDAVARANATVYGLSAGILTSDPDRGLQLAQQIQSGIVHVNDQPVADEPQMPFGGVKDSGFGRFGGQAVIDEFTETRWITVKSGPHPFPF